MEDPLRYRLDKSELIGEWINDSEYQSEYHG